MMMVKLLRAAGCQKPWKKVNHLKVLFRLFYTLQRYRWRPGTGFMLSG